MRKLQAYYIGVQMWSFHPGLVNTTETYYRVDSKDACYYEHYRGHKKGLLVILEHINTLHPDLVSLKTLKDKKLTRYGTYTNMYEPSCDSLSRGVIESCVLLFYSLLKNQVSVAPHHTFELFEFPSYFIICICVALSTIS